VAVFTLGRVCVKTRGREEGLRCMVVDTIDEAYVLVTGPKSVTGVRRRRVNIAHLSPLDRAVRIRRGASDHDVEAAITRAGLLGFMKGEEAPPPRAHARSEARTASAETQGEGGA